MTDASYRIERYRRTRFFALSDKDGLVAVTAYKKGASAVRERLEEKDRIITELRARFNGSVAPDTPPPFPLSSGDQPTPERNDGLSQLDGDRDGMPCKTLCP